MNLKQNTLSWHKHRQKYINASEVSAIMGLNPYETKEELFKRKIFNIFIKDNKAMQHGRTLEPQARIFFNKKEGLQFEPRVFVKNFMSSSLDGWNEETKSLLEIKCPLFLSSLTWQSFFAHGEIPIIYYAQLQAQMYCSQARKAYFLVYLNNQKNKIQEVKKDNIFISEMLEQCYNFFTLYIQAQKKRQQLKI